MRNNATFARPASIRHTAGRRPNRNPCIPIFYWIATKTRPRIARKPCGLIDGAVLEVLEFFHRRSAAKFRIPKESPWTWATTATAAGTMTGMTPGNFPRWFFSASFCDGLGRVRLACMKRNKFGVFPTAHSIAIQFASFIHSNELSSCHLCGKNEIATSSLQLKLSKFTCREIYTKGPFRYPRSVYLSLWLWCPFDSCKWSYKYVWIEWDRFQAVPIRRKEDFRGSW